MMTIALRLERHSGELPVLTNAPDGLRLCVECGHWQDEADVTVHTARCQSCREDRQVAQITCNAKQRYHLRRRLGLCVQCGTPSPDMARCARCREIARMYRNC